MGIFLAHCAHDRNPQIPFPFPNRHNALLDFVKKPECPMWVCSDGLMPCPLCFDAVQGAVECMPSSSEPLGGMKLPFPRRYHARSVVLVQVVAIIIKMSILNQSLMNLLYNALEAQQTHGFTSQTTMSPLVIRDPKPCHPCVPCDGGAGWRRPRNDGHILQLHKRRVSRQCGCTYGFEASLDE